MATAATSATAKPRRTRTDSAESRRKWEEARAAILAATDILNEYRAWGLILSASSDSTPNEDGWISCYALGRDESNPSAGVNVIDGRYKDFGGNGDSLSFFYAAAQFSSSPKHIDAKEATRHYAKLAGVKLPGSDDPAYFDKQLGWLPWVGTFALLYSRKRPPIDAASLVRMGARRALWPKPKPDKHSNPSTVFALPVYGPKLLDADPTGWVLINQSGGVLSVFQGKEKPRKDQKTHSIRGTKSGLMNRSALSSLPSAEIVWKVEGVTDCLALESVIPDDLRGRHIVLTNSAGTMERPHKEIAALFAGRTVHVLHDADKPGEAGVSRWVDALLAAGATVRHVRLPYEIADNHGKDLRDWLNENHTYADLLTLADESPIIAAGSVSDGVAGASPDSSGVESGDAVGSDSLTDPSPTKPRSLTLFEEQLLNLIGLDVLGEHESGHVRVYSRHHKKVCLITNVDRLGFPTLQQICGPAARDHVSESAKEGDGDSASLFTVRQAIGLIAGNRRIEDGAMLGQGCWPLGSHLAGDQALVVVNGGSSSIFNGRQELEPNESPLCRGRILDLSNTDPWVGWPELAAALAATEDPDSRAATITDAIEILSRWRWRYDDDPTIAAGLMLATFVQSFFDWRPQVAILGESGSGKTTFFEFVGRAFGGLAIRGEKPTEAGLRQAVGNSSRAVILDEFEEDKHRQHVLELIRTSSRGESSAILRGSQDQRGRRFALRHICWVAAIEIGLKRDPDRNRFVQLEMLKPVDELRGRLSIPSLEESRRLGIRLLAVAIRSIFQALNAVQSLRTVRVDGVPDRVIESYAVPVAMLVAGGMGDVEWGRKWLEQTVSSRDFAEVSMSDQQELLDAILSSQVQLEHGKRATVAEILSGDVSDSTHPGATRSLEASGVTRASSHLGTARKDTIPFEARNIVFMNHKDVTRNLLRGTKWAEQSIDTILLRLNGAERGQRRIASRVCRGIDIPAKTVGITSENEF